VASRLAAPKRAATFSTAQLQSSGNLRRAARVISEGEIARESPSRFNFVEEPKSENGNGRPGHESAWYVVSVDNGVVAGPLADKSAAERLAVSLGLDHVVKSGPAIDPDMVGPADPV
jgi:hypothetical protein